MIELLTHCPQCQFQFGVTLEQLQQRNGLFRCTQCAHIFDAYEHAINQKSPQSPIIPDVVTPTAPPTQEQQVDSSYFRWHFIGKEPLAMGLADAPVPKNTSTDHMDDVRVYLDLDTSPSSTEADLHLHVDRRDPTHQHPINSERREPAHPRYAPAAKKTHVMWELMLWLLGLCLLAQLLYVYRAQVANTVPLARPLVEMMCELAACEVPYMREIKAIEISNSALKQQPVANVAPGLHTYVLQLQMKNSLAWAQEWPTLVVSFSDAAAAALATVAIAPEQYLTPSQLSRPFEAGAHISIRLPVTVANKKINGFTVEKYYP